MRIVSKLILAGVLAGAAAVTQAAPVAQPNDAQLDREIETVIGQYPSLRADALHIDVVDGVAYVHGEVSTSAESLEAVKAVAQVQGVTKVVDSTSIVNE